MSLEPGHSTPARCLRLADSGKPQTRCFDLAWRWASVCTGEQHFDRYVISDPIDHTLNELLSSTHLIVVKADAKQSVNKHI
jgi:hypothetical protein